MKLPIAALGLAVALAAAAGARAQLPSTAHGTLIVPGHSVGAVRLGGTQASVEHAWGAGACHERFCLYGSYLEREGYAAVELVSGVVRDIEVRGGYWGTPPGEHVGAALARLRTARGIGLGSRLASLRAAYPHGRLSGHTYVMRETGGRQTDWQIVGGVVGGIAVKPVPAAT